MSHYSNIYKNINKAILDMEKFTIKTDNDKKFVYRYGFMTSCQNEGVVIANSHASTKKEVEKQIKRLDRIFTQYTTTAYDIEVKDTTYYLTYAVYFPFKPDEGNVGQSTLLF